MAEKTSHQLHEWEIDIDKMAKGIDFGLMSHVMSLLSYRQKIARECMEKRRVYGSSPQSDIVIDHINEEINKALLTHKQ